MRAYLSWALLAAAVIVPIVASLFSPFLAWRDPIYIAAGLAGIVAFAGLLVQPVLVAFGLPGLTVPRARTLHRWTGILILVAVILHVAFLWITSPPDVIDVLLFASPTPFSVWGVIAMWAVFLSAALALFRRRLRLRPGTWRLSHTALAVIIVVGTVVHAMLIEGTMEIMSKTALAALVILATTKAVASVWSGTVRPGRRRADQRS